MKDFYDTVEKIKAEYNVPYLDYSHDDRFMNDKNLFFDSSHLNKSGRNKFMPILLNDLGEF
jgi:lysophospholipase L1-like esterase